MLVLVTIIIGLSILPTPTPCSGSLVITLHDVRDRPVVGAAVTVRAQNATVLGEQLTDAEGRGEVCALAAQPVRVIVTGTLRDGTALTLPGADATGIRVALTNEPTTLALRVEPSGQVLPDPATLALVRGPQEGPTDAATYNPALPVAAAPAVRDAPVLQTMIAVAPSLATRETAVPAVRQPATVPSTIPGSDTPLVATSVVAPPLCLVGLALLGGVGAWFVFGRKRR